MSKNNNEFGYWIKFDGSYTEIKLGELDSWKPEEGILWLHLNFTSKKVKTWLNKKSGIDKAIVRSMLTEESRPRHIAAKNGSFLALRSVNHITGKDLDDMVSLRIWIDSSRIITLSRRTLVPVDDTVKAMKKDPIISKTSDLLIQILSNVTDKISDTVENLNDMAENLEVGVMHSESSLLRPQLSECRRDIIMIRRYLAPQREALYRLSIESNDYLNEDASQHIREFTDRTIRYIEILDLLKEQIVISQEELTNRLSELLNQRMYRLSVVTSIFLPLSFVTGLLGINVGGIPFAENKNGFNITILLLFGFSMTMLYFLRRKKWI